MKQFFLQAVGLLVLSGVLGTSHVLAQQEPSEKKPPTESKNEQDEAQKAAALKRATLARKVFQNLQKAFQGDDKAALAMQEALDELLKQPQLGPQELRVGMFVAQVSEIRGDYVAALNVYQKLEAAFANSDDKRLAELSSRLHKAAKKRLGILGKPLVLEGTLVDGKELDWEPYKGKVVLVDFWATWCGPCLRELPNVLKLYQQYHPKGFEIIGVSLDSDKERLEKFLEDKEIPWQNLFSHDKENQGWEHPLAQKLGVSAIPHTILIGRDGKVLALGLRGQRLAKKLEELLGPPEEEKKADSEKAASK